MYTATRTSKRWFMEEQSRKCYPLSFTGGHNIVPGKVVVIMRSINSQHN